MFKKRVIETSLGAALLVAVPLMLAVYIFGVMKWDFSIPLSYGYFDDTWQLVLTKSLIDNHWVFVNPYLGAPGIADWHYHPAAQSSALHSVLMLAISIFIHDPVRVQQFYYFANFPLICCTTYLACRLLGLSRLPAFCVGMLYAFTTYRLNVHFYAYLANYFMIPLAMTPVIWVMSGRFAYLSESLDEGSTRQRLCALGRKREFLLGLLFVVLMAVSDGYYAFFTLILLAFSVVYRLLLGDGRRPTALMPPLAYITMMVASALLLQLPMMLYKHAHLDEFYQNGVEDPALVRHSFEAEVYSDTLKLMISPPQNHRLGWVRRLATRVVDTAGAAMKYPHAAAVPLGTLGAFLFLFALLLLAVPEPAREYGRAGGGHSPRLKEPQPIDNSLLSLSFIIFLCSITGGLGTIIALIYPSIRAYQRFPLFLIFVLYVGGFHYISSRMRDGGMKIRFWLSATAIVITIFGLWDQIPVDIRRDRHLIEQQFLAERDFVHRVETSLPEGAMVYQYPYSQYLSNNKYYGWGAFYHLRLYLHSQHLHWSNGGAKNAPAEKWNVRISQLPVEAQITEIEAAGFNGLVVDDSVLDAGTEKALRSALLARGYTPVTDGSSRLSFTKIHDPGYRIFYDATFDQVDYIKITNRASLLRRDDFSVYVDGAALKNYVSSLGDESSVVIKRSDHPELFYERGTAMRGSGQALVSPAAMKGEMRCDKESGVGAAGTVSVTLTNRSDFDWRMDSGPYPIRVGVLLKKPGGELLADGYRVKSPDTYLRRGDSEVFRVPLERVLTLKNDLPHEPMRVDVSLVQDANTWYDKIACTVPVLGF